MLHGEQSYCVLVEEYGSEGLLEKYVVIRTEINHF